MSRQGAVTILGMVAVIVVVVAGGAAVGGASSTPHDNGIGLNYTVGLPNDASHQPGADSADIRHYAAASGLFGETSSPDGFKRMDTLTIYSEDVIFGTCSTENTKAFGIDRDDDSPGTKTDEGLLSHRENSEFNEHSIFVDFYGEGSLAGEPVALNDEDQVVAAQEGCYGMPEEPGWYQINARINGTGYNGNYIDTEDQGTVRSHYFYVCDCSSEQEAREKLGPPPSDDGGGGDGGDGSSTATPTPEPTATESAGGGGGSATATATPTATATESAGGGGGSATATATPTPTATATPTPTATPTDDGGASAGGGGGGSAGAAGQTATVTATAGADANTGGGGGQQTQQQPAQQGAGPGTPTAGAGPGFGLVAALGGVLAVALLALRRD